MGTPLTEGSHLYLDRSKDWKNILLILLNEVGREQEKNNIGTLCLRDFPHDDTDIIAFFQAHGFLKMSLPDTHVMDVNWNTEQEFLEQFNSREKWYLKDNVLKYEDLFITEIVKKPTKGQIDKWYGLYKNVKDKSFDLNTFALPKKVFENMINCPFSEIIQLKLRNPEKVVGVSFNFKTANNNFCGVLMGLDYHYLTSHAVYKQTLYQSILRAGAIGSRKMFLGFMSSQIKKKFGATAISQIGFIQMQDHYSWSVINSIPNNQNIPK
jgi:predicted N-acyltransferase